MKKLPRGVTLVELLAAIAIVFLLATLLFTGAISARDSSRTKACLSNVRQLSSALAMYVSDNDSAYPESVDGAFTEDKHRGWEGTGYSWHDFLSLYLDKGEAPSSIYCPATSANDDKSIDASFHYKTMLSGYAYNDNLSKPMFYRFPKNPAKTGVVLQGMAESEMDYSSLVVTFAEARCGIIAIAHPDIVSKDHVGAMFIHELKGYIQNQPSGATRHQDGANYSFMDGHVKWFQPGQLNAGEKCDGKTPGFGL